MAWVFATKKRVGSATSPVPSQRNVVRVPALKGGRTGHDDVVRVGVNFA